MWFCEMVGSSLARVAPTTKSILLVWSSSPKPRSQTMLRHSSGTRQGRFRLFGQSWLSTHARIHGVSRSHPAPRNGGRRRGPCGRDLLRQGRALPTPGRKGGDGELEVPEAWRTGGDQAAQPRGIVLASGHAPAQVVLDHGRSRGVEEPITDQDRFHHQGPGRDPGNAPRGRQACPSPSLIDPGVIGCLAAVINRCIKNAVGQGRSVCPRGTA